MSKSFTILLDLILLAVLGYFCINSHSITIQEDIQARSQQAILQESFEEISVIADGRNVILIGEVSSEELKSIAEDRAWQTYGVRNVDNQLVVNTPAPVKK